MAVHSEKITDRVAKALPQPAKGYTIFWCPRTDGFGVRVTANGARAWVAERRVDGETVRRTLGKVTGAAAITADAPDACKSTSAASSRTARIASTSAARRLQRTRPTR